MCRLLARAATGNDGLEVEPDDGTVAKASHDGVAQAVGNDARVVRQGVEMLRADPPPEDAPWAAVVDEARMAPSEELPQPSVGGGGQRWYLAA